MSELTLNFFANNPKLDIENQDFCKKKDIAVFFNHGEHFSKKNRKKFAEIYWFSRYNPYITKKKYVDKINGGVIIKKKLKSKTKVFIASNYSSDWNDYEKLLGDKRLIESNLRNKVEIINERELHVRYDLNFVNKEKHLSTGSVGILYMNTLFPNSNFKLWGFDKNKSLVSNDPHDYFTEFEYIKRNIGNRLI